MTRVTKKDLWLAVEALSSAVYEEWPASFSLSDAARNGGVLTERLTAEHYAALDLVQDAHPNLGGLRD